MKKIIFLSLVLLTISSVLLAEGPPEDMVYISAGEFIMGNDEVDVEKMGGIVAVDELPRRNLYLKAFYMDKYELTNKQYKKFIDSLKKKGVRKLDFYKDEGIPIPINWSKGSYRKGEEDSPVVAVDWYMANKYCESVDKRLPTEEEWEKAARGTDGRTYPWGNNYESDYSNNIEHWADKNMELEEAKPLPVGSFKTDVSPYGVYDMTGNVLEWTSSLYRPYPGNSLERDIFKAEVYVLRGGAYNTIPYEYGRTTSRHFRRPSDSNSVKAELHSDVNIGFRCAR